MVAVLAELKRVSLRNAIFLLQPVILLHLDRLDGNLGTRKFVLADEDWIARSLTNCSCNDVLVQLIVETLLR